MRGPHVPVLSPEISTTRIARNKDGQGFDENRESSVEGGTVAGVDREELEKRRSESVIGPENYLDISEKEKRKKLKDGKGN